MFLLASADQKPPPATRENPNQSRQKSQVLKILFEELIPKAGSSESKVFYLKMKGDLEMSAAVMLGGGFFGWIVLDTD